MYTRTLFVTIVNEETFSLSNFSTKNEKQKSKKSTQQIIKLNVC